MHGSPRVPERRNASIGPGRACSAVLLAAMLAAFPAAAQPPGIRDQPERFSLLHPDASAALDSLVAAERGFSALSVARGMREAFLANLSDSGIIFRPLAVNGKGVWQGAESPNGTLIWEPAFAEVSSSGDLGYTTGPWEYRPAPERNLPISYGDFNSVWRREADGVWRVVVDIGGDHPKPERGVGSGEFSRGMSLHVTAASAPARAPRTDLAGLDRDLSSATRAKGIHAALAARAAADIRLGTDGAPPAVGVADARSRAAAIEGSFNFITGGSGLARSDDLGYTYGVAQHRLEHQDAIADSSVYLHVWRRGPDRHWKLALVVWNRVRR